MDNDKRKQAAEILNQGKTNFFKTKSEKEFKDKLSTMTLGELKMLASKVGVINNTTEQTLRKNLLTAFKAFLKKEEGQSNGNYGRTFYQQDLQDRVNEILKKNGKR